MNIFCTDPDPSRCAYNLDDKRIRKMILETSQMLSTAIRICRYNSKVYISDQSLNSLDNIYHSNHPCCKWVRENKEQYLWTLNHYTSLLHCYYTYIQGQAFKTHWKRIDLFLNMQDMFHSGEFKLSPNCARNRFYGLDYTEVPNIHLAYKLYLCRRWVLDKHTPIWTNREEPLWRKK